MKQTSTQLKEQKKQRGLVSQINDRMKHSTDAHTHNKSKIKKDTQTGALHGNAKCLIVLWLNNVSIVRMWDEERNNDVYADIKFLVCRNIQRSYQHIKWYAYAAYFRLQFMTSLHLVASWSSLCRLSFVLFFYKQLFLRRKIRRNLYTQIVYAFNCDMFSELKRQKSDSSKQRFVRLFCSFVFGKYAQAHEQ